MISFTTFDIRLPSCRATRWAGLFSLLFFILHTLLQAAEIKLDIEPPPHHIRPLVHSARFVATLQTGRSDTGGGERFRVRLTAPNPGRLFSTDFPQIEGKRLLDMEIAPGEQWEYVFPIRGVYRMEIEAFDSSGAQVRKVVDIRVKEQRRKYLHLGIMIGVLFVFGFVAARIFTVSSEQ